MIYFIRDEATKFIKIGHTDGDIDVRLRALQTGCPGALVVLFSIDGSKQDETTWHDRFAAARERGEWFRPVPELLQDIDEVKASIEENVRRILQKLKKEQEEFERSGGRGWSAEEIEYLRMLQLEEERSQERRRLEEERRKLTAAIGKLQNLVDALGSVVGFRKLYGVLNALEMQIEDGNYRRCAVTRLCEALVATVALYDIPAALAGQLEEAACAVATLVEDRR